MKNETVAPVFARAVPAPMTITSARATKSRAGNATIPCAKRSTRAGTAPARTARRNTLTPPTIPPSMAHTSAVSVASLCHSEPGGENCSRATKVLWTVRAVPSPQDRVRFNHLTNPVIGSRRSRGINPWPRPGGSTRLASAAAGRAVQSPRARRRQQHRDPTQHH